jgi:hypothetical protein
MERVPKVLLIFCLVVFSGLPRQRKRRLPRSVESPHPLKVESEHPLRVERE